MRTTAPEEQVELVHKSVWVPQAAWHRLRLNAEISHCNVRDFLTYLIENSSAVNGSDPQEAELLRRTVEANRTAKRR